MRNNLNVTKSDWVRPPHSLLDHLIMFSKYPFTLLSHPRQGLASPLSGGRVRIAGMVEAVGWDHTVEQDKGRRVMEALREVFAEGMMKVWLF